MGLPREVLDDLERYVQPAELRARWLAEGHHDSAVVGEALRWPQQRWPSRTAIVDAERRVSYGEIGAAADALAGAMRTAGVGSGDIVSWQAPNWWESVVVALATWRLGAINNPILMIYREHELRQIVSDLRPTVIVAPQSFRGVAHQELTDAVFAELGHEPLLRIGIRGAGEGWVGFDELLASPPLEDGPVPADPDDPCVIAYTSGTTARAKGVVVNSRQFLAETRQMAGIWGLSWKDRTFMPAPLAHLTGLTVGLSVPMSVGGSVALMDAWDPARAVEIVEAEGAVFSSGTPTMLEDLCNAYEARSIASPALRQFSVGGAAVAPRLIERCDEIGIGAFRCYGSTEHLTTTIMNAGYSFALRSGTDGPIAPGTEISCVDEDGREVPLGEAGVIRVRGPERMMGYVNPADNEASLDPVEGWFSTGDVGFVDGENCIHISGRIKDIINRGGEKFSAREMEDVIAIHPAVRQVAIVPLPDDRFGEVPAAVLVLRDGAEPPEPEELARFVLEQGLAKAKTPVRWHVVDALPTTPFGKVKKQELISWLTAESSSTSV